MKTYTVRCERDSTGWWVVTVPELPGAVSQARRLDQVSGDVAEVVELMTGQKPGTFAMEIETVYPGAAGVSAREAVTLRRQAEEISTAASDAVRNAVLALRSGGLTLRDSATLAGVSYQRAQQIRRTTVKHAGWRVRLASRMGQAARASTGNVCVFRPASSQRVTSADHRLCASCRRRRCHVRRARRCRYALRPGWRRRSFLRVVQCPSSCAQWPPVERRPRSEHSEVSVVVSMPNSATSAAFAGRVCSCMPGRWSRRGTARICSFAPPLSLDHTLSRPRRGYRCPLSQ
jgi:predicted RNase H-like HicB family nuclease